MNVPLSQLIIWLYAIGSLITLIYFLKEKSLSALKWFLFSLAVLNGLVLLINTVAETFGLGEQFSLQQVLDMIIEALRRIGEWFKGLFKTEMILCVFYG